MSTIKIDSILTEYDFTQAEVFNARVLTPLQVQWLQNKFALKFKEKAAQIVPATSDLDREYLLKLGELEGYLNCIQELFLDHQTALADLNDPDKKAELETSGGSDYQDLAARASKFVNQSE